QTSVKPPVEAPTSSTTRPATTIGQVTSACSSFSAPRPTQGWSATASIAASSASSSAAFSTTRPSAVTPPAAMAARALTRLSKSPRATSSRSARVRTASSGRRRRVLEQRLQLILHDLAVGVARQHLVPELHRHRHLEGRQPFGHVGAELILGGVRAGLQGDHGARLLAER